MRHLSRILFPLLLLLLVLPACGGAATPSSPPAFSLVVFAGASLTEPFQAIATTYHATHSHVTITYNFAAGPALLQQLSSGASADVLALADPMMMKKAQDAGLVNTAQTFAKDTLVVILPSSNPAKITSLKDLAKHGVKISVENPNVPAGMATRKVLANMAESPAYGTSYQSAVNKNIVSQEETVKGVVQKVQLGEVDAGFALQSDVTAAVVSRVNVLAIPETFNVVLQFPVAVVKQTAHVTEAQAFVQYLLSQEGQTILTNYKFMSIRN